MIKASGARRADPGLKLRINPRERFRGRAGHFRSRRGRQIAPASIEINHPADGVEAWRELNKERPGRTGPEVQGVGNISMAMV